MGDSSGTYQIQKKHQPACSHTPDPPIQPDSHLTCQDLVEHIPTLSELDSERRAGKDNSVIYYAIFD